MDIDAAMIIISNDVAEFKQFMLQRDDCPAEMEQDDWYDQFLAFLQLQGRVILSPF